MPTSPPASSPWRSAAHNSAFCRLPEGLDGYAIGICGLYTNYASVVSSLLLILELLFGRPALVM